MALSDAWVAGGCHLDDPTLAEERLTLVASYTALREASDRSFVPNSRDRHSQGSDLSSD
jgi:hypothetical protein